MNYDTLDFKIEGSVGIVTINRPEAMNALNTKVFSELNAVLDEVERLKTVKGIIVTGNGKAFVAGADIAEMVDMGSDEAEKFSLNGQRTFDRLESLSIPVIAAVNGYALGGGCELAMACDIRIAGVKAKFGQPEVSLGLIPGFAGTQRLSRHIGLGNSLLLLMSGDMVNADEALRIGLVQKVVEQEELIATVKEIIDVIISRGPKAVSLVKMVTRKGYDMGFREGSDLEAKNFGMLFGNEGTEGMKAFLEKRKPEWEEK